MSKLVENGNVLRLTNITGTYEKLPIGVYNLEHDEAGFFLNRVNDLTLPKKIYGDMTIVDRWLNTYRQRERNLGVLLSGLKGSGKTIMAKLLAIKSGLPIINIQASYGGANFISFITNSCLGDCVFFLDEYEKVYCNGKKDDEDASLLSVLDGPYSSHHLFIFTVNETKINSNLMNRPSRIFYHKNFKGLPKEQIQEVAEDLLINKDMVENLVTTSDMISDMSFDTLISIIGEMNRYGETAMECISNMNLSPGNILFDAWQYYIDENGKTIRAYAGDGLSVNYDTLDGKPKIDVRFNWLSKNKDKNDNSRCKWIELPYSEFKKTSNDTYEYFDGESLFVIKQCARYSYYGYGFNEKVIKVKNQIPKQFIVMCDNNNRVLDYYPKEYKEAFDLIKNDYNSNDNKEEYD